MIDLDDLVTWLTAVPTELDYSFRKGPRQPEFGQADLVALVTPLEGPGLTLDGLGSVSSFQIKLVAREHQETACRKSAFQIDDALLFSDTPGDLWGTWIQYVNRLGGEPASLEEDEHDRIAYVCSYVAHETPVR